MPSRRESEALDLPASFRQGLDELRQEYDAGNNSRYLPAVKGVRSDGSGADYHYRDEIKFLRMIERSRHYDRNNLVVGQGVNRLVANVIQDGFTLDPQPGPAGGVDKGFSAEIKARWYDWAEDESQVDIEQEKTFYDLEQLVFRAQLVDGDMVPLLLESGAIQCVEAHRVRTPRGTKKNVVHGVEMSESGQRLRYWISKRNVDPLQQLRLVSDVQQVPVLDDDGHRQVLHCYAPWRMSQTRGVPVTAPIVYPLNFHDDLQFAQLVKAQMAACWAILEEDQVGSITTGARPAPAKTGAQTEETLEDGSTRTREGVTPGMRIRAPKGRTLRGFSPNVPNAEFFQHATLILTFIAINLDLPVHVLLLDPSKTNFSGWRGAIEQARMRFRVMQKQFVRRFHGPIYKWKLRQWAAEDPAIRRRLETMPAREFFSHVWNPPTWAYIEPNKDIQADAHETASSLTSRRRMKARRGEEWSEIVPEIVEDNGMLIEAAVIEAKRINEAHALEATEKVNWREVAALPLPDGVSMAIAPEQPEPEPAAVPQEAA